MLFDETRLNEIFAPMTKQFIAVVGDVMLDRYIWGHVSRISPEAPVPVVDVHTENNNPGGAANVALNIRSLGAVPILFGVIGDDMHGERLRSIFHENNIATDFLVVESGRPTTVKTRVIAGHQHVVRIDYEKRAEIREETTERILDRLQERLSSIHVIILQDYNKGVISQELISGVRELARQRNIPICVDPKYNNFFNYTGVTVFKPNRNETEDALGVGLASEESFVDAAKQILDRLGCENVLLTLGELGMLLLQSDGRVTRVPTRARKVSDVSGAGDTVIATLATALGAGASVSEAAKLANIAGGLVCEEIGVVPINRDALFEASLGPEWGAIE